MIQGHEERRCEVCEWLRHSCPDTTYAITICEEHANPSNPDTILWKLSEIHAA